MKVTCEYCGSYVEADEHMHCPLCGGDLGSAVRAETARLEAEAEAERARAAQQAADEAKQAQESRVVQGLTGMASALVAGSMRPRRPRGAHPAPPYRGRPGSQPGPGPRPGGRGPGGPGPRPR